MDTTLSTLSTAIDQLFRPVGKPLGQLFGSVTGGIAENLAPDYADLVREQFTKAGEALPRFGAEALAYGAGRLPVKALGLADVALRSSQAPGADVGSTLAQTGAFALSPGGGRVGERLVSPIARLAQKAVVSPGAKYLTGEAVKRAGGLAGGFAPFEAAGALEAYRKGEDYKPFSAENVVGNVAAALPFEALHLPGVVRGYKAAVDGMAQPLVNQRDVTDQPEAWRVHWQAHDRAQQCVFMDKQTAFDFGDELRKTLRTEPFVEPAGTLLRSYVKHEMAFKPEQLQAGVFGLRSQEVLNGMGEGEYPGQQVLGTLKNKVPKSELEALPGLEDFLKGQKKVQPQQVREWLDANAPKVEVKTAGEGAIPDWQKRYNQLSHEIFDSKTQQGKNDLNEAIRGVKSADDVLNKWGVVMDAAENAKTISETREYVSLAQRALRENVRGSQAQWAQVSPKPENEMPGYVELAVTVPYGTHEQQVKEGRAEPRFLSSHFFPPNTLGWARGYMETGKDGKKVFHVIEVQSDWAQTRAEQIRGYKKVHGVEPTSEANRLMAHVPQDHPLLPQWERLVLKAVIDHAVKNGADAVAVSDAETAMMTEGHDASHAEDFGRPFGSGIPQEPGMRLHYDRILPKILSELTGQKGEKVSFGDHKMAFESAESEIGYQEQLKSGVKNPRSNLIFREPTGEPKTSVTAQSFSLSRTKAELAKRGGFPMFGGEKFVKDHVQQMITEGYDPNQIVKAVDNVKMLPALPGEYPLQTLARSVGIDPKLFSTIPPGQALPKAFEFLTSMFHHNFGYEPDHAAQLARQTMMPLIRFAPWLGQTSFAVAPGSEGASRYIGIKHPGTETFQHIITLLDLPKSPVAARQSPESQVFDLARSLGHEAAHNTIKEALNVVGTASPVQRRAAIRALANVEAIPPKEREGVMQSLLRLIVPAKRWPEVSKINMENYADSPEEFLADFSAIISVGAVDRKTLRNMQDALTFGDRESQEFSGAVYRDLTSVWSGVRDWMKTFWGNRLGTREGKQIAKLVDGVYQNMTSLMQTREQSEKMLGAFHALMDRAQSGPLEKPPVVTARQLQGMFSKVDELSTLEWLKKKPQAYQQASMQLVDDVLSRFRPYEAPRVAGERLSFWKDFMKPMSQLVESLREKVPSAVPVKALGFDYRGMVSEMQNKTWQIWADEKGKVDWKRLSWLKKDGSPQERAFSEISLVENVRTQIEKATEFLTREEREQMSPAYRSLSDEDKDKVDLSHEQAVGMTRLLARKQWDAHRDRIAWEMAKVVMSFNKALFHDKAKEIADQAVHWIFDTPLDVEQMGPFFTQREAFFNSLPLPDAGKRALEEKVFANRGPWQKLGDSLLGPADTFTGERPGKLAYLPEVRVRDWHVAFKMTDEKVPHHEAFKTEALASKRRAEIEGKQDLEWVKTFNRKDRTDRFRGAVQEEISSAQQDALDALLASVISGISSEHPEAQDIIAKIKEEFQPATAFANVTVSPYMKEREFMPGREDLNMAEGLVRYIDAVSYQMAKRHVKQAGQAVLFNPDMRENPNVRNEFEKYLRFVTDAEGKEFNTLKNLVFFHYIGFNPATALVEPTQQLVTLAPYLVDNGMGIGQAYKAIKQANLDVMRSYTGDKKLVDPVEQKALDEAILRRTVDTGFVSDLYGETDLDFAVQRSMFSGNDQLNDKIDLLRKPLYQILATARHAYGWVTSTNGRVAFLTAFRHEYGRSHDYEKAVSFARQATDATMYGGGKAARPLVLQRFGSMSGVGGVMYTLGSYTLNTVAMMGRLTRKAILDSSLTTQEKNSAMKAAGLMWATQLAFGGALGLPLVGAGLAVLEQIFPGFNGLEFVRNVSEHIGRLATDDEDMGHTVADGAMRGPLNLTGVDFGSRFQLGNLLGVSPYDGFSWANLAGPAASMLGNYVKAVGQASTGHWGDAARQASPVALRQVLNLIHNDWDVRDKAGRLIEEIPKWQQLATAIGFKSQKLTNYYEQQHIRQRTEETKINQLRDIKTEAAKLLVSGDVNGARQRILQGVNEAGPYDPIDMAREAAQLATEMQSPVVRRQGTRAVQEEEEARIASLYPKNVGIGEVQRILRQRAMMQQMGLQIGKPSMAELRVASLVDSLMSKNPRLTLVQARAQAEQMTSITARRHSALSGSF